MELDDKEYVAYAASLPDASDLVLELEQDVERLNAAWEEETDYLRLMERRNLREEDERSYLEENRRVMEVLKDGYRSMTV